MTNTSEHKEKAQQQTPAANSHASGISLPAVPVLQQKETEEPVKEFSGHPGKNVAQLFGAGTVKERREGIAFEKSLQEYSKLNGLIKFRLEIQAEAYADTPQEAEIRSELFEAQVRRKALQTTIIQQWPAIKKESLDPYYQPLVETIISENLADQAVAPEVIPVDPRLAGLLDHFSRSWGIAEDSTAFQSRIARLQLTFINAYPDGNCHGYSLHHADEFLDFSIPEWRRTQPRIVVYTLGSLVGHSAELNGGRITQTFSNRHPLFSCDMAAFDEFSAGTYNGRFVLPDQLDDLIMRINYQEQSQEESTFLQLLDELGNKTHAHKWDDDRKGEIAQIIANMYEFTPENVELLAKLKKEIDELF